MELGPSPAHLKPRTRSRGSKQSDDNASSSRQLPLGFQTPSHRANLPNSPAGIRSGVFNTPGGHRSAMINTPGGPGSNLLNTPRSANNLLNTPRSASNLLNTPHSALPSGSLTPSRPMDESGGRSMLNSPANSARHSGTPKGHQRRLKHESASPVAGRIAKVFRELPFARNFDLKDRIGEGTFSTVYLATRKEKDVKIALKHLVPTSKPSRILMETSCMKSAAGHPNVIELLGMWRVEGDVILAMPHIKHARFSDLIFEMDLAEIQAYIGNLLAALRHIHKLGIIHRDIKPSNFLYDRHQRKYALVDFGLAQLEADVKPGGLKEDGRGAKRKMSEGGEADTKRIKTEEGVGRGLLVDGGRGVLVDAENKLNRSPRARILRDSGKSLRRSPRKSLVAVKSGFESAVKSGLESPDKTEIPAPSQVSSMQSPNVTPRKQLRLSTTPKKGSPTMLHQRPAPPPRASPRKLVGLTPMGQNRGGLIQQSPRKTGGPTPPVRQSPRKHSSLSRVSGFSQIRITSNSIMGPGGSGATPSPSLSRTPSFTILEPASYNASSQATDNVPGFTPLLRASITSAYSSVAAPVSKSASKTSQASQAVCSCGVRAKVCSGCLSLPQMHAPRAGTPGFRPPEVLLKHPNQGTAIDLWAVGVILISILSRSYPFFRAPDDMTALAELTVLFGSKAVGGLAARLGRNLLLSVESEPVNLAEVCKQLSTRERRANEGSPEKPGLQHHVNDQGVHLLAHLLAIDQRKRISAEEALKHEYFKNTKIIGD